MRDPNAALFDLFSMTVDQLIAGKHPTTGETVGSRALYIYSTSVTPDSAQRFERLLEDDPHNFSLRVVLLSYYREALDDAWSPSIVDAWRGHALWAIEHRPDAEFLDTGCANLDPCRDGIAYQRAKRLWLRHIGASTPGYGVLNNCALFFCESDLWLAEMAARRGQELWTDDENWPELLAQIHLRRMRQCQGASRDLAARKAVEELARARRNSELRGRGFLYLFAFGRAALEIGAFEQAQQCADALAAWAEKGSPQRFPEHFAHEAKTLTGLLALRQGDVAEARDSLRNSAAAFAAQDPKSHGPSFALARELLEAGQTADVLAYLRACAEAWNSEPGQVDEWLKKIQPGRIPDWSDAWDE